jgi:hypothetical protein
LLFVTIFKASLLGSVGICAVQYLWRVLRGQPIPVSKVESLFQLRHNPLELFSGYTLMSVSFLVAAYTWLVPLATIYPPGALTVKSTAFRHTDSVKMSVPELQFDSRFNPLHPENISRLAVFAGVDLEEDGNIDRTGTGTVQVSSNLQPMQAQGFLQRLSRSVIAAGETMPKLPETLGENSTYILEFMGPQLSCRTVERSNRTTANRTFTDITIGGSRRNPFDVLAKPYEWQIMQQSMLGGTPCQDSEGVAQTLNENGTRENDQSAGMVIPNGTYSYTYLVETTRTNCTERYVDYVANFTYSKGVRSIRYTTRDLEPQPLRDMAFKMHWEASSSEVDPSNHGTPGFALPTNASYDAGFAKSLYFKQSKSYLQDRFRHWNALTVYAAFLETLETATSKYCDVSNNVVLNSSTCTAEWTRPNGSRALMGPVLCDKYGGSE